MVRQPGWQRTMLLVVLGYEAIGTLAGGCFLLAAPDGHLMNIPVEVLHGFFTDFFIPGLLLIGLGILNSFAFVAVWRRRRTDWLFAGLALGGMTVWFGIEIAVLGEIVWLHVMWGLPVLLGAVMALPLIPAGAGGQSFIKVHPVLTFYLLAFIVGWGGILLGIAVSGGLPTTLEQFTQQVGALIPAVFAGPVVAGLLMTAFVSGRPGFAELFSRLRMWLNQAG
jgi:hypothetical protein